MRAIAFVILLSAVLFAATAQAVVPGLISYQGTLTDDGGVALDTTVAMTFTIYYDSTGAGYIWTETQPSVVVASGIFNVLLGSVNPLLEGLFGGSPSRWLGVQVGGDPELVPRQQIVTVAHAFHAAVAETADYAHSAPAATDGDWIIAGDDIYSAVLGDVGIGKVPMSAKFDVNGEINTDSVYEIGGVTVLSREGTNNIFVGAQAGENNTGSNSTFVGYLAGQNNQGGLNTFVGHSAGQSNTSGSYNTFMGRAAGLYNSIGNRNTFLGHEAGRYNTQGYDNTFVGKSAGFSNATGYGNVFIGKEAGYSETGSEKLYIANGSATSDVLIYGDFSTGHVGIGTLAPSYPLHVVNPSNVNFSRAIYGVSTSTGTGQQIWGVAGENNTSAISNPGAGVYGLATNTAGRVSGVRAEAAGENGRGVFTWATHSTGENYGIYAETSSPNGYAGYFRGGMNYFQGDVGIGVLYPSYPLDVVGYINNNAGYKLNGYTVLRRTFTNNLMVGMGAGENNTGDYNTFVGDSTGINNSVDFNTFLGTWAGYRNTTGDHNTFLGTASGYDNTSGDFNTFVGMGAGGNNTGGFSNVCLGYNAGNSITTGDLNVCLGNFAGYNNITGNSNVFIGLQAGYNETGSDKLYIANGSADADVLIYGDFSTGLVGIGTTSPGDDLEVVGEVDITSALNTRALDVYSTAYTTGQLMNVESTQDVSNGGDILQLKMGSASSNTSQFIECEREEIKFQVEGDGNVYADGSYLSPAADFAEMIAVSTGAKSVEPGDVMVIDSRDRRAILKSGQPRSTLVAGIYSTRPGFVALGRDTQKASGLSDDESSIYHLDELASLFNEVPLAVVGIVPCKVSAENGAINPGDLLVTSTTPGHAMRDEDPRTGTVVGKALESLGSGTGLIKVLVTLQ